jgi:hypothetical protein
MVPRLFTACVLGALVASSSACGGGSGAAASPSNRTLPSWSGRAVEVFDDAIEPAAVGLDYDKGYTPRGDPLLRERANKSDGVIRVRVTTVTAKTDGPEPIFQMGMTSLEKLNGEHPPPTDFTVTVSKTSSSHGILKSLENRIVGKMFIAFVREFVRPDGDHELHFHLAPDSKDVKTAVGDAVLLGDTK